MFYTNIKQLPTEADQYFIHYHNHFFTGKRISTANLKEALTELRLAYSKYTERRPRIKEMADVITRGINAFSATDEPEFNETFTDVVKQELF